MMAAGDWAVEADGLRCGIGGRPVLDGIDLRIPAGCFVGVFGANGAGKTTLFKSLLGMEPLQGGRLRLLGGEGVAARTQVGYVAQRDPPGADGFLSVSSFVAAAWRAERWGFAGRADGDRTGAVAAALRAMEADDLSERAMDALSGGQRQRVRIAQALVNPVRMLLLDEPLANLDPQAQQRILQVARKLCNEQRLTVMMTAHDINPLLPHMDRVLYLANGKGLLGRVDEVVNAPSLSALYGLPMAVARDGGYLFIHPASGFMAEGAVHCGHDHAPADAEGAG